MSTEELALRALGSVLLTVLIFAGGWWLGNRPHKLQEEHEALKKRVRRVLRVNPDSDFGDWEAKDAAGRELIDAFRASRDRLYRRNGQSCTVFLVIFLASFYFMGVAVGRLLIRLF